MDDPNPPKPILPNLNLSPPVSPDQELPLVPQSSQPQPPNNPPQPNSIPQQPLSFPPQPQLSVQDPRQQSPEDSQPDRDASPPPNYSPAQPNYLHEQQPPNFSPSQSPTNLHSPPQQPPSFPPQPQILVQDPQLQSPQDPEPDATPQQPPPPPSSHSPTQQPLNFPPPQPQILVQDPQLQSPQEPWPEELQPSPPREYLIETGGRVYTVTLPHSPRSHLRPDELSTPETSDSLPGSSGAPSDTASGNTSPLPPSQ
ncbi:extensin-like [Vicia villosa]|uniref:extensin-like n=1 Tax=Vicia villosa TaxID=3911 RepID=UPI00273CA7E9|nr:extensin-like [Vicia villosa]